MILIREYELPAAHQLTDGVPVGHPCRRLHGHNYGLKVFVHGDVGPNGMVLEYSKLDEAFAPVLELVDHHFLNRLGEDVHVMQDKLMMDLDLEFEPVAMEKMQAVRENPTAENLARWLYVELNACFEDIRTLGFLHPHVLKVELREDNRSSVVVDSK